MAVFISLVTEAFDSEFRKKTTGAGAPVTGLSRVRRPTRGIELKEENYGYLKLVRADGVEIPLLDSSSPTGESTEYANFLLQSVQDSRMEKSQVIETFGENYLVVFGEGPRYLNVSAVLLNTADFQWRHEFMQNYERYMRGTRCVEEGARAYLFYDQNVIEGYIVNAAVVDSVDQHVVPLQFQFFVTKASSVANITADYPRPDGTDDVDLGVPLNGEEIDLLREGGAVPLSSDDTLVQRELPLRGKYADNEDEYTGGPPVEIDEETFDFASNRQNVNSLPAAFGSVLSSYGVVNAVAFGPSVMVQLGLGPIFRTSGVGVGAGVGRAGAGVTFGATPGAIGMGGFAGMRVGAVATAQAGFTGGSGGNAFTAGNSAFGTGTAPVPYDQAYNRIAGFDYATNRSAGYAPAYASALALAQFRVNADRFAYAHAATAARGGGYVGANGSLGFTRSVGFSGAGNVGAPGITGASISVGGRPTAFAYLALPGTLTNANLPPAAALQSTSNVGVSAGWRWPSVA